MIHLATGLLVRDDRLLMVASRYANHAQPLWNLPGGRQLPGELLAETVVREVLEETGLHVDAGEVAYMSESYDGDVHYLNVTFLLVLRHAALRAATQDDNDKAASRDDNFEVAADAATQDDNDEVAARAATQDDNDEAASYDDRLKREAPGDHVVAVEWVPLGEVARRIVVGVVREPLLAYLRGELRQRYAGFHEAGVTIEWPEDSR